MLYTKEIIAEKITTDQAWTERAVVAIFNRQTSDEQYRGTTVERNFVGFNGCDAEIMSSFALWIIRGRRLTPKQLALAQKKIRKYAGQLVSIANEKEVPTSMTTIRNNNGYSSTQFTVTSTNHLVAEASELRFVPDQFIRIDGILYEMIDTMSNDDEDITGWMYSACDHSAPQFIAEIFND